MDNHDGQSRGVIYTIGHSIHSIDAFLALLVEHTVDVLVDVRSQPYSRYAPHFESRRLNAAVTAANISYLFMGKELGGRPDGAAFYDPDGRVRYDRVAESPVFLAGIARLQTGIDTYRVAIMCAEEDPAGCHRRLLVGRVLVDKEVEVRHIRGDGRVQIEQGFGDILAPSGQLALFPDEGTAEWKSIRSVLPREGRRTSLEP